MTTEVMLVRIRRAQEGLTREMQPDGRPSVHLEAAMARAMWDLAEAQRHTMLMLEEMRAQLARIGGAR